MNRNKTALHLASGSVLHTFNNAIKVSMRMQFFEFLSPFLSHSRHHPTLKSIRETAHGCRCLQLKSKNKMHITTASTPMSILSIHSIFVASIPYIVLQLQSQCCSVFIFFSSVRCVQFSLVHFLVFPTCTQTDTNTSIIQHCICAQCIDDAHCTLNTVLQL